MGVTFFSAFVAGLLTFFAPCTLPLVPGFLSYITGASSAELKKDKRIHIESFFHGLFFVLGFSLIFIVFGVIAGLVGSLLISIKEWLVRIGGVIIIIFGLYVMGVFNVSFFEKTKRFSVASYFERGKYLSAFIFGISFGVGWSPCIGPILGSILLIASSTATLVQGGILLGVFSLGLAIPFLLVSLLSGFALNYIARFSHVLKYFSFIGGSFLIFLGVLMFIDRFGFVISWGYRILDFFNYDALLNYL